MGEIELKFSLSPNQHLRILKQIQRQSNASQAETQKLDAYYFDTPSHELHKAGLTLRVRSENGTFKQTVKREGAGGTATLLRQEWEDALQNNVPDIAVGKSGRVVRDVLGKDRALRPAFRVCVTRTRIELGKKNGTCVEAALDRGEIETIQGANGSGQSNRRRCPIHELELELKHGNDTVPLFDIALSLSKTVPLRFETLSKAERGYALLEGNRPPPDVPVKKRKPLGAAMKTAGRAYFWNSSKATFLQRTLKRRKGYTKCA